MASSYRNLYRTASACREKAAVHWTAAFKVLKSSFGDLSSYVLSQTTRKNFTRKMAEIRYVSQWTSLARPVKALITV